MRGGVPEPLVVMSEDGGRCNSYCGTKGTPFSSAGKGSTSCKGPVERTGEGSAPERALARLG